MESLTFQEIISAVNGTCLNSEPIGNINITSISIDSRDIKPGTLYIPIKGDKFDGHVFIADAFHKGCAVALTEQKLVPEAHEVLIYVKDTKQALMDLATYYRKQFNIPVVAVTGSVGKTTTKDLIASVLSAKYSVHKTQGNFNNEIGLPLTIFGLTKEHQVLVVEMGMNHFGEIHNLSMIARPDIGVITNIGVSHIEHLGSRKGILKAKCEILDGMGQKGVLIVNGQDEMLQQIIVSEPAMLTYGRDESHPFYADGVEAIGKEGMSATFYMPQSNIRMTIPAMGEHMIDNALAAIAVAKRLHLSDREIQDGIEAYKPSKMRMDLQEASNGISIINDAYNASPDSMKAAIEVLGAMPVGKRKVAILGDMFELGEHAQQLHEELGEYIAKTKRVDLLITVGTLAHFIQDQVILSGMSREKMHHFETQDGLILKLGDLLLPQDLVLVKASRGMALEKTVDEIGKVKVNE